MNLLIVKLGSIGDIVHTLPAVAALRAALADAHVAWAVERSAAEILRGSPLIDELIEIDSRELRKFSRVAKDEWKLSAQLGRLRRTRFDAALDFQGLWKSAAVAFLACTDKRYGFAAEALREPSSRVLMTKTFDVPRDVHVVRKNLALVHQALNIEVSDDADNWRFPIALTNKHAAEAAQVINETNADFAIINPGGNWWTKLWSAEKFGALADALYARHGLRSVVTYGPGEEELAARVTAASKSPHAPRAYKLSLKGFCALAKRAQVYVGGDTGPTHLAIASNAPVVGLFGPTEWWRNGSPRAEDIVVAREELACRVNCHRRACDNWVCMDISVERVAAAVAKRLRRRASMPEAYESNRTSIISDEIKNAEIEANNRVGASSEVKLLSDTGVFPVSAKS